QIYGGCFSEDGCWYRCTVQQCQVLYIDYGNSEVLNRSEIVEIPADLQCPSVAKKYRLWGLQIPPDQNLNMFDQGKKFLGSLVFEKEIKIRHKAKHEDGTIIVQAEYEKTDIGEEVAKTGFAEKFKSPVSTKNGEEKKADLMQNQPWNLKVPVPVWINRHDRSLSRPRGRFEQVAANARNENFAGNRVFVTKEKMLSSGSVSDSNLEKQRKDQMLVEENEKLKAEKEDLRREKENLVQMQKELELQVEQLKHELQEEKKTSRETAECFEKNLSKYIGTKMRSLVANVKVLKEIRHTNKNARFGEDLSQAIEVVTEGCLAVPCSLEKLQKTWVEYDLAQEMIQLCKNVDERDEMIMKRNEVQANLYSAVEELILEVDQLPLSERSRTLQELSASLEVAYGQVHEVDGSERVFEQFFKWQRAKTEEFIRVRNDTNAALKTLTDWFSGIVKCFDLMAEESLNIEEVIGNVDEVLKKVELDICKELETDLAERDEADEKIITSAYTEVIHKIRQEQHLITVIQNKYLDSVEFKKEAVEWLNKRPNTDNLISIKKTLKNLKAQLRWKLVEKSNFEESDDYSEFEMARIKDKIAELRNSVLQEIYKEQEEYEKLTYLVQKWFPELPLLYPEAGILKYMNSGGLLTLSLERDLLDVEPMKELSTKRPLVCAEIQDQKVLLKVMLLLTSVEALPVSLRLINELILPEFCAGLIPVLSSSSLKVMKGVAKGLNTLHGASIVHGSLHGNNVFAVNRQQGIVGDFDFTKTEEQRAGALVAGALSLVSPELKRGQPPSAASDMFAFGGLLLWV
ncbi:STK31 kinase, partial [Nothocercus julius]|nr:STK31 kinase [Nothocercus julius]